jgi:hypothetical protein
MNAIVATLCAFVALATFPIHLWAEQPRPVVEIPADVLVVRNLFRSPEPAGDHLRKTAELASLHGPTPK